VAFRVHLTDCGTLQIRRRGVRSPSDSCDFREKTQPSPEATLIGAAEICDVWPQSHTYYMNTHSLRAYPSQSIQNARRTLHLEGSLKGRPAKAWPATRVHRGRLNFGLAAGLKKRDAYAPTADGGNIAPSLRLLSFRREYTESARQCHLD